MNRHPSSRQPEPPTECEYWVQGFPGDDWRRLRWIENAFRLGLTCERWYAWKPIGDEDGQKDISVP